MVLSPQITNDHGKNENRRQKTRIQKKLRPEGEMCTKINDNGITSLRAKRTLRHGLRHNKLARKVTGSYFFTATDDKTCIIDLEYLSQ